MKLLNFGQNVMTHVINVIQKEQILMIKNVLIVKLIIIKYLEQIIVLMNQKKMKDII